MSINLDQRREDNPAVPLENTHLVLFTLNGREYKVPAKPAVNIALRFLDDLNKRGEELAVARMLPKLLGEEAWEALLAEDDLTMDEFQSIAQAASQLLMGNVQGEAVQGLDDGQ